MYLWPQKPSQYWFHMCGRANPPKNGSFKHIFLSSGPSKILHPLSEGCGNRLTIWQIRKKQIGRRWHCLGNIHIQNHLTTGRNTSISILWRCMVQTRYNKSTFLGRSCSDLYDLNRLEFQIECKLELIVAIYSCLQISSAALLDKATTFDIADSLSGPLWFGIILL